ncbi:MAG: LysR family transcriptional regulator [Candidatus Accumulibacter sp.]|uniref:LysR family transcriptional regulator n=1 Tax=Candidatus Accumulibacter TaxID=327159 RepID=UPI001AC492EF|nr:LysR family transcriptional regulator [Accumulibacter sp.]MBK8113119.1 LysR family transcriptional regulator [Accumulibacter sp.]MBK8579940.1 LysR family transcriptional regulator [Candidatus Accumulibacter propinquus]MBN8438774.1 LysR family transcriptional regulator [Accumulibacter sp.]
MDHIKQIEAFVNSATRGSLSAAAQLEGITPAVIGRRLDALEARLGVKLLLRSTRKLSLTFEGQAFLEDCQRILNDLANAEAAVSLGGIRASGHLKVSAPAGFGRRHVAPQVAAFMLANPDITVRLDLTDRLVDLLNEGVDCAVRIGEMADSSLASNKLGEMHRVVVASPAYLAAHHVPRTPAELATHNCLSLGQQRGWALRQTPGGEVANIKVSGTFECNDGAVLHAWALAGKGLAWRSMWEVGDDLRHGLLVSVLDDYAAPAVGIYAVFPQRRHLPLRVRLFIDQLKITFGNPRYWGLCGETRASPEAE